MRHLTPFLWCMASFILSAFLLAGVMIHQDPPTVQFHTTAPVTTVSAVDAMDAARAYADAHGLTSCVTPDKAFAAGSDVVLTVPADASSGAATSTVVTPVSLDEALESAGERRNLLACADNNKGE